VNKQTINIINHVKQNKERKRFKGNSQEERQLYLKHGGESDIAIKGFKYHVGIDILQRATRRLKTRAMPGSNIRRRTEKADDL
jgi:hypothetical protein